jgi:hypothetical protein
MFHFGFDESQVAACMRKLYNKLNGSELTGRRSSSKNLGIMKDHSGRTLFSSVSVGQSTSYGIKTDPLIKFAIFLCCILHDAGTNFIATFSPAHQLVKRLTRDPLHSPQSTIVSSDHPGVPNQLLIEEESPMAAVYKKRSIAEQNR